MNYSIFLTDEKTRSRRAGNGRRRGRHRLVCACRDGRSTKVASSPPMAGAVNMNQNGVSARWVLKRAVCGPLRKRSTAAAGDSVADGSAITEKLSGTVPVVSNWRGAQSRTATVPSAMTNGATYTEKRRKAQPVSRSRNAHLTLVICCGSPVTSFPISLQCSGGRQRKHDCADVPPLVVRPNDFGRTPCSTCLTLRSTTSGIPGRCPAHCRARCRGRLRRAALRH